MQVGKYEIVPALVKANCFQYLFNFFVANFFQHFLTFLVDKCWKFGFYKLGASTGATRDILCLLKTVYFPFLHFFRVFVLIYWDDRSSKFSVLNSWRYYTIDPPLMWLHPTRRAFYISHRSLLRREFASEKVTAIHLRAAGSLLKVSNLEIKPSNWTSSLSIVTPSILLSVFKLPPMREKMDIGAQSLRLQINSKEVVLLLEQGANFTENKLIERQNIANPSEEFTSDSNIGLDYSDWSDEELVLTIRQNDTTGRYRRA